MLCEDNTGGLLFRDVKGQREDNNGLEGNNVKIWKEEDRSHKISFLKLTTNLFLLYTVLFG